MVNSSGLEQKEGHNVHPALNIIQGEKRKRNEALQFYDFTLQGCQLVKPAMKLLYERRKYVIRMKLTGSFNSLVSQKEV